MDAKTKLTTAAAILKLGSIGGEPCWPFVRMSLESLRLATQQTLWEEEKHDRDESGKFTSSGGGPGAGEGAADSSSSTGQGESDDAEYGDSWDEYDNDERADEIRSTVQRDWKDLDDDTKNAVVSAFAKSLVKDLDAAEEDFEWTSNPGIVQRIDDDLYAKDSAKYEAAHKKVSEILDSDNLFIRYAADQDWLDGEIAVATPSAKKNKKSIEETLYNLDHDDIEKFVDSLGAAGEDVDGVPDIDDDDYLDIAVAAIMKSSMIDQAAELLAEFTKTRKSLGFEENEELYNVFAESSGPRGMWDYATESGIVELDPTPVAKKFIKENPELVARNILADGYADSFGAWEETDFSKIKSLEERAKNNVNRMSLNPVKLSIRHPRFRRVVASVIERVARRATQNKVQCLSAVRLSLGALRGRTAACCTMSIGPNT